MLDHQIAYGHRHLSTTLDKPVQDFEGLRRDAARICGIPGSSYGGPSEDPRGIRSAQGQSVTAATVLEGVVHYAIPGTFTYRVILDGDLGELICGDMMNASFTRSVRISQVYSVGTRVLVLKHHGLLKGTIIGAPAREVLDYQYDQPILASAIGRFHIGNRGYVKNVVKNPDTGKGIPSYTHGRAIDTCEGDYMISNMAEGGFFTSPYETSIRQTHDCGVWIFSMDRLLRLVGRSVQEYSLAHERYAGMDEHETYGYEGTAMLPWEALGYYGKPDETWKKHTGTEVVNGKGISFMEPKEEKAEPFYRQQVFTGWLGQGLLREMRIPPKNIDTSDTDSVNDPDDGEVPICVAREQMLADGTMIHESMRAIHFVKHGNIRSFKRTRAIDDPRGDDLKNGYEFSKSLESRKLGGSVTDQILSVVRKQAINGFREHSGDFLAIPDDQKAFEKDVGLTDLSALETKNSVEEPPSEELSVDGRSEKVTYESGRATVSILDNGDIVLRNACGAEIALRGSNIELSAPGDVRLNLGRSFITLAGDDIVLRAKNSADLTATDNDVRIKAERNLDMVGGMGGRGRTLLENKASGSPNNQDVDGREGEDINGRGLVLKAEDSMVAALSQRIYLRSLNSGTVVVDADHGNGSVKIDSRITRIHGSSAVEIGVAADGGTPNVVSVTASRTISKAPLEVHGGIIAEGSIASDAGVNVEPADNFSKPPENPRRAQMEERVRNFVDAMPTWFDDSYWAEDKPGHKDTIKNYTFSYRTTDQYGASRFKFETPFWMELYGEEVCSALATWAEPTYQYQDTTDQQPWPGYETWTEKETLTTGTTAWYDDEAHTDRDKPEEADSETVIPNDYLRIIDPR